MNFPNTYWRGYFFLKPFDARKECADYTRVPAMLARLLLRFQLLLVFFGLGLMFPLAWFLMKSNYFATGIIVFLYWVSRMLDCLVMKKIGQPIGSLNNFIQATTICVLFTFYIVIIQA